MRVRADQLGGALKKTASALPVYLVTGDEHLLHAEACDLIRADLREKGFTERELFHVDAQFNWDFLFESANSLSLFAERRILELRLGSQKISKAISDQLQRYLENPAPDTALLMLADRIDGAAKKSAWFKRIEQAGLIVEIWPVELEQLPQWLAQRGAQKGLQFEQEALMLLADRIEGNLLAADQELEKLSLLFNQSPLTTAQVDQAVSDSARFDPFTLTDAALSRQPARCQHIVQALKQEGVEPPVILWALTRELRIVHEVIHALAQGSSYDSLAQKFRIWGKRKTLIRNATRTLSITEIEALLIRASEADAAIKGLSREDAWLIIAQIALRLAGSIPVDTRID